MSEEQTKEQTLRKARLQRELRSNLKRRKDQARARRDRGSLMGSDAGAVDAADDGTCSDGEET
ncbi:hypothetical protein U0C82_18875 [Fulvimarina sp. 2208YS6-2-32]|uniref:DUF4169 family protein n=1 Tax=Fulvimarina uroteuthidis TaxID=3098149 RepID=A0ABU5I8D0_9HYPH|nr:hypothetical protein [Fulvimarina sp. 2208YS6-2-32]MDY8111183.1 hypothetical protein [Fulvimarina sp. 2208YS6-2-32]